MSSSSDSFRVAILLCYHVLCDIVCLWVARDFNISNLGYERCLPPNGELPAAGSQAPSQPVDGGKWRWPLSKWRKGNVAAEIGWLDSSAAEICTEKSWEVLWQGILTGEGGGITPCFSHFFPKVLIYGLGTNRGSFFSPPSLFFFLFFLFLICRI